MTLGTSTIIEPSEETPTMADTDAPKKRWYTVVRTGEIGDYWVLPGGDTTMCRGTFLGEPSLVAGFNAEADASEYLLDHSYCSTCRDAKKGLPGEACTSCGGALIAPGDKT